MVYIATDRYVAVVRPSHLKIGGRLAATFIIIAWLLALVVSIPWDVQSEHLSLIAEPETGKQTVVCRNFLPPPSRNEIHRYIVTVTLGQVLPLICTLYCLVIISSKVYSVHVKIRPSVVPLSHLLFHSEMRTATTVIIMISLHVLCWLPYIVLTVMSCISSLYLPEFWYDLAIWLTWVNKAVNPTIYALRNKTVSQYFRVCVCCFRRRKVRRPDIYKWTEQRPRATSIASENRLQPYSPNIFFARSSVDSDIALTSASGDMRQSSIY
ncbi:G-protein coupled receptor 135-like [Liolophura sinensis]|uniref:G-protein coupled receptor 135-like n=1 Tax=Liolophura sinensis TaxID=3198878 RepID=UPI0031585C03